MRVYLTPVRPMRHGGTKGCPACFGQAQAYSAACRARCHVLPADATNVQIASCSKTTGRPAPDAMLFRDIGPDADANRFICVSMDVAAGGTAPRQTAIYVYMPVVGTEVTYGSAIISWWGCLQDTSIWWSSMRRQWPSICLPLHWSIRTRRSGGH